MRRRIEVLRACTLAVVSIAGCGSPNTRHGEQVRGQVELRELPEMARQRVWAIYVSAVRRQGDIAAATEAVNRPMHEIPADVTRELREKGLSQADLPRLVDEAARRAWADSAGCRFTGEMPIRQHAYIYPPALKHQPPATYTEEACAARLEGMAIVDVVINRDGSVRDARVIRGLPAGFDDRAIESVKASTWWPALLCGSPVPVHGTVTVSFELNGGCREHGS